MIPGDAPPVPSVLFVVGSLPPEPCGVGHYTDRLAGALGRSARVGILASARSREADPVEDGERSGDGVVRLREVESWGLRHLAGLADRVDALAPDVVHLQLPSIGFGKELGINLLPALLRSGLSGFRGRTAATFHEPFRLRGKLRNLPTALALDGLVVTNAEDCYPANVAPLSRLMGDRVRDEIPVPPNIPSSELDSGARQTLRSQLRGEQEQVIAFFGLIKPSKGMDVFPELLQELGDTRLVFVGAYDRNEPYHRRVLDSFEEAGVEDRLTVTGWLPDREVANILASSDACVFPFRDGVKRKNASFLAAVVQGTFTVTTSRKRRGYAEEENVAYVPPGDVGAMADALREHAGRNAEPSGVWPTWSEVASRYAEFYRRLMHRRP